MEAKFKSLITQWTPEPLVSNHHHFWVMTHSAILNDIAAMVRIKPALLDKFKNHPTLRAINNQIIEAVKDVVDTTENKFTDDRIAEDFLQQIEVTVQMLKYLHPLLFDARRVIVAMVQYLVQRLATPGKITKQKERAMWIQQKSVERCLGQLMALKD
jgi:hypothetical protein